MFEVHGRGQIRQFGERSLERERTWRPCLSRAATRQPVTRQSSTHIQISPPLAIISTRPRDYPPNPSSRNLSSPKSARPAMAGSGAGEAAAAVERAHELYRGGRHREALELYSAALEAARGPAQRIALHSNRAACYLKLHDFRQAAEECTSVLELDREHAGALMLRAQTLVTLKDYQSALFDVNRLIEINPASEVYRNLHARLKTQISLAPIPECEEECLYLEEDKEEVPSKQDQKIENPITKPDQPASELSLKSKPSNEQILERKLVAVLQKVEVPSTLPSKPQGWESIPKPKGHSGLDYSKWDKVEDDSSDEEDNDEEELPQYKFKVRTVGVRSVK